MILKPPYTTYQQKINDDLETVINEFPCLEENLQKALCYSVFNGGKRLRPLLMYTLAQSVCDTNFQTYENTILRLASSCELVHSYSLVHDDLPAMDNDDWRRGKLACHKQFDEATAILVGDALQSLAFSILSIPFEHIAQIIQLRLINLLANAIGHPGMVGGQALDLQNKAIALDSLTIMHRLKTGALFDFAIEAPLVTIGCDDPAMLNALKNISYHLGLAFQIQDDILDVEGSGKTLGKPTFSDQVQDKCTFVTVLGLVEAKQQLQYHYDNINKHIDDLSLNQTTFGQLLDQIQHRSY